jgi:ankyrin repeat protein
MAVWG